MPVESSSVAVPIVSLPFGQIDLPGFDERWAAWRAHGAAHDRAVRQRLMFAVPVMIVLAGAMLYAFVIR